MSQEISKAVAKSATQDVNVAKSKSVKQLGKLAVPAVPAALTEAEIALQKLLATQEKSEQDNELQNKVASWLNPSEEREPQTTIVLAQASTADTGAPATATDAGSGAASAPEASAATPAATPAAEPAAADAAPPAAAPAVAASSGVSGWLLALGAVGLAAGGKASDNTPPDAPKINAINTVNAAAKAAGVIVSGTAEANSVVTVTWGTATATATTNPTGVWTTTIAAASVPADGTVNVVASAKDGAGNKSTDTTLAVKIDATAPSAPVISAVATDNVVNAAEKTAGVVVSGTAEAGSSVAITWGSAVKTVTAAAGGTFTATFASADMPADAANTTISAIATDGAGNASAAGTKTVAIDTGLPTAPVISAVSTDNVVNAAEKAAGVVVSGTAEAGSSVAITWGSAVKTVTAAAGGTFTATFASADVPADAVSTTISAVATDAAGNASAAGTRTVGVDTGVPAAPVVNDVAANNIVNAAEKTAGISVSGTAEAGSSVAVTWGTVVKTVTASSAGAWTASFAAADVPADAASTTVSAVATDAAGNASAAGTRTVAVDSSTPNAPVISAVATDNIVNATEKAAGVAVSGTAEAGASVAITWGATVKTATAAADGTWTTTFASATVPSDAASTSISAIATDTAGNASTAGTKAVAIDTAAPTITVLAANSASKTITLTYSEALDGTNLPATTAFSVSIGGVANPVSSVAVNGTTMVLTLTNTFSAGAVSVAYTDPTTGNDVPAIQDLAGNDAASFTNTVVADGYIRGATVYIDVNKNGAIDVGTDYLVGTTDENGNILIPGSAPAGSIIAIGGVNIDTGAANTMILKAPQGATTINPLTTLVQAVIDKAPSGTVVDATYIAQAATKVAESLGLTTSLGGASLLSYDPIAKGDTTVQKAAAQVATIVSLAGNAEAGSTVVTNLASAINNQATNAPTINLSSSTTLSSVLPTNTSDATKAAIASANTSISTATNLDGITTAQSVAIDKTAPDAPKSVEFTAVTSNAKPVIKVSFDASKADGSSLIAGDTLTVKDGTAVLGSVIKLTAADLAKGYVEVTAPTLSEGAHSITASFADKAGNNSAASTAKTLTVDLTAPAKPSITAFADNSGSTQDTITNDATPTLTISAEAGSTVEVFSGTTSLGKAKETSTAGVFSFTADTQKDGTYAFTTKSTDAAGNNATSNAQSITIDTTKPATAMISNVVEGTSTVALTILGEAGSTLDVYAGSTKLGAAVESTTTAGQFSYSAPLVNTGKYSFTTKAADTAGNTADSAAQSFIFAAGQSFQTVTAGSVEVKLISSDATKATFGIYPTGTSISIDEFQFSIALNTAKVTYTADTAVFPASMSAFDAYEKGVVGFGGFGTTPITSSSTAIVTFSLNWVSGPTAIDLPVSLSSLAGVSKPVDPSYKFVPGSGGTVVGADDVKDTFLVGSGQVTVTGGKGADVFALTSASNNTLSVTDFTTGSDAIDVSRFLTSVGYTSTKDTGAVAANVALLKSLALSDLTLVAGNSATLDNVAGYVFEAATSGTNKGTLHLIVDKNAAIGTGNVSLVQIDIVLGANSTGFAVTDLITTTASKPVI